MATTDMNYRFLWDTEPTDAQLQTIMQEVGEDIRNVRRRVATKMREKLRNDFIASKKV
jgi:arsenate reductase-like glutaredoxin family protein